jgi:serine/threonine-protein kinase
VATIDNIVLKAIEAEPERRYASAGAFADDIVRMLDGRPVAAHPPSRAYRARKFVQRHRGGVAATFLFLLALVAAFGIALWQAKVARDAAHTAGREAARANATKDFLLRVFRASDPRVAQDKPRGEITAKELLDLNAPRIDKDFASDPDTQIELLGVTRVDLSRVRRPGALSGIASPAVRACAKAPRGPASDRHRRSDR